MLFSDDREDAVEGTGEFPDSRVHYFWDGDKAAGRSFGEMLQIDRDAWDVYLLYPKSGVWTGSLPPKPSFWMHQLGGLAELAPALDSTELRLQLGIMVGGEAAK